MIISRLQGVLDQMFQWAYGRSLEVKYGKKMFLNVILSQLS
jgi:hypothetical protein